MGRVQRSGRPGVCARFARAGRRLDVQPPLALALCEHVALVRRQLGEAEHALLVLLGVLRAVHLDLDAPLPRPARSALLGRELLAQPDVKGAAEHVVALLVQQANVAHVHAHDERVGVRVVVLVQRGDRPLLGRGGPWHGGVIASSSYGERGAERGVDVVNGEKLAQRARRTLALGGDAKLLVQLVGVHVVGALLREQLDAVKVVRLEHGVERLARLRLAREHDVRLGRGRAQMCAHLGGGEAFGDEVNPQQGASCGGGVARGRRKLRRGRDHVHGMVAGEAEHERGARVRGDRLAAASAIGSVRPQRQPLGPPLGLGELRLEHGELADVAREQRQLAQRGVERVSRGVDEVGRAQRQRSELHGLIY